MSLEAHLQIGRTAFSHIAPQDSVIGFDILGNERYSSKNSALQREWVVCV